MCCIDRVFPLSIFIFPWYKEVSRSFHPKNGYILDFSRWKGSFFVRCSTFNSQISQTECLLYSRFPFFHSSHAIFRNIEMTSITHKKTWIRALKKLSDPLDLIRFVRGRGQSVWSWNCKAWGSSITSSLLLISQQVTGRNNFMRKWHLRARLEILQELFLRNEAAIWSICFNTIYP